MKTSHQTIIAIIISIIIIVAAVAFFTKKEDQIAVPPTPVVETPIVQVTPITGCYVSTLGKDVYTLNIQSEFEGKVTGTLTFKNFETDSSSGTFMGMYVDGILDILYAFSSEGMDSEMQVIFKKTDKGFVRGLGDVVTDDAGRVVIKDKTTVTYDPQQEFIATPCQ